MSNGFTGVSFIVVVVGENTFWAVNWMYCWVEAPYAPLVIHPHYVIIASAISSFSHVGLRAEQMLQWLSTTPVVQNGIMRADVEAAWGWSWIWLIRAITSVDIASKQYMEVFDIISIIICLHSVNNRVNYGNVLNQKFGHHLIASSWFVCLLTQSRVKILICKSEGCHSIYNTG